MKIGIICAMDEETDYLLSKLVKYTTKDIGPFRFYEGETEDGKEVVVSRSGIGKAKAAADTALLISTFNVGYVINSGIAGSMSKELNLNDIVFSTSVLYHDADFTPFGYKLGQMPSEEPVFNASPELIAKADIAASTIPNLKDRIKKGLIISGDQFINTPEQKADILTKFPQAMVTECEGAPIAHIATSFKIPFIIIRSVSDSADEKETGTYDFNVKSASENSARLVLAMIKML
ncbi:MAG: 5'-methylthioadenosine/adenosylhomocysteine nucleosidase [Succinivibrio dextrinosolvens]|uniref:5'-methylthioadenosine/adenosylhomocysteine nucleosidase n=1 Tax=Succinivibrio sp. TaxID=2053619 RepID=UPI0025E0F039|nr:5'-methylthioadenosine/adenosylhomocysteine nucleosidase [Succinivibrio sp.]MBQ9220496.1 5'-methylthioadenosine/adenosylhomocysteine nucleosidase [Succinivibrio sp.]MDY6420865.1 5'-methylthioadenosine/adenosylhomocysteine nucleosidase [Succinivibrio dextrinosolvens]MDY6466925.1 5'-methylthioadenosine/adenosylhomocysteine nucleosidase [Succinivibrio dextrinosolvens]MDY6469592.1 5'-methylthioadenosine/adenosylhomocysteine nucleosidase [Succinivibrio dextrinosolvens]